MNVLTDSPRVTSADAPGALAENHQRFPEGGLPLPAMYSIAPPAVGGPCHPCLPAVHADTARHEEPSEPPTRGPDGGVPDRDPEFPGPGRDHGSCDTVSWPVPSEPAAVSAVRAEVAAQLSRWGLEGLRFSTELIVSELTANAIRHGCDPIRLRMIRDNSLICEVSDGSGTVPRPRRAGSSDEGGRGLALVAQLADRWGHRRTGTGKVIWTEQSLCAG